MQDTEIIIDNDLEPRRQRFNRGWTWIYSAFELYLRAPLRWTLITLAATLLFLVASIIPGIGWILGTLLMPLLLGSIMQIAKRAEEGTPPEIMALFTTFSAPKELLKVGLFYLIGVVAVVSVLAMFMLLSIKLGLVPEITPALVKERGLLSMWPFLLMFFTSLSMVYSAYFFAPTLVVLRGLSARDAMRQSFLGFWRNWLPIFIMGIVGVCLLALAMLPFFLGLLVALPVTLLSSYTSYTDIYEN